MALQTRKWDAANYLNSQEDIAAYIDAILEEGDDALFYAALGDVARSKGMSDIAKKSGVNRESLYKALDTKGNPGFSTIVGVLHALGLRISVRPSGARDGKESQSTFAEART